MEIKIKNLKDCYRYYKQKTEDNILISDYIKIILGFVKFLVQKMFDGYDVKLGPGDSLGFISVIGKKKTPYIDKETGEIKNLAPSWSKTKELWMKTAEEAGID